MAKMGSWGISIINGIWLYSAPRVLKPGTKPSPTASPSSVPMPAPKWHRTSLKQLRLSARPLPNELQSILWIVGTFKDGNRVLYRNYIKVPTKVLI